MNVTYCRSCRAHIVWLKTLAYKHMPVDADYMARIGDLDGPAPVFEHAIHADGVHWRACPNADQHRKAKR
jgi:hypothetical protein